MTRLKPLFPLLGIVAVALSGCTLALDTPECESDSQCEKWMGPGAQCVQQVCVITGTDESETDSIEDDSDVPGDQPVDELELPDELEESELEETDLPACEEGLERCDEACVELQTSQDHCGVCGNACGDDSECLSGKCEIIPQTIVVTDNISSATVWSAPHTYVLNKPVYVINDAQLVIQAGVTVLGAQDAGTQVGGALIVTRGSRLIAQGSEDAPIVFTSAKPEGQRAPGDWGGVALLGYARSNNAAVSSPKAGEPVTLAGEGVLEGLPYGNELELPDATWGIYGGSDPDDDNWSCGTLKYVRIEFAGYQVVQDKELNGLTFGGCGRDTIVEHVQVHKGSDDGIEVFGGTVGMRHIVISSAQDDSLDWDRGWTGSVQFLLITQEGDGDNAFECDNNSKLPKAPLLSQPQLYNVTVIGNYGELGGAKRGVHFKAGTGGQISNMVLLGHREEAIDISECKATDGQCDGVDGEQNPVPEELENRTAVQDLAVADSLAVTHSYFYNVGGSVGGGFLPSNSGSNAWDEPPGSATDDDFGFDEDIHFRQMQYSNVFATTPPGLWSESDPYAAYPRPTSTLGSTGVRPPASDRHELPFDQDAIYIGAFIPGASGERTWIADWTAFPPN